MHDDQRQDLVANALAVARVRALRLALLALHKTLIETERRRYEKDHGRIESPHAALRVVLEAPAFQWLHPFAEVIVQMDEKLAEEGAIGVAESESFVDRVRNLLHGQVGSERFRQQYRRALQDAPEVVMAHAEVARHLTGL
jgi:trans-aconitate methyltransferase